MCYRLITLVTLLLAFGKIQAQEQTPYTIIAIIPIDSGQLETYLSFLKEGIETAVKKEPGVLSMHAVADKAHPQRITIMETYASKSAYDQHIQTAHFQKYKQGTLSMVKSLELTDVVPIIHIIK
ncbi:MAG: putative quinol monooxygenase [bacterium]